MTINVFRASLLPPSARRPRALAAVCRRALRRERRAARGELNIVFLDRRGMRALNRRYLDHDRDTDVIAFRYAQDLWPVRDDTPFGDIFISAHQARTQAVRLGHPVLTEVLTLAAHGMLHLLGYDDRTPRGRDLMARKQRGLLPRTAV